MYISTSNLRREYYAFRPQIICSGFLHYKRIGYGFKNVSEFKRITIYIYVHDADFHNVQKQT